MELDEFREAVRVLPKGEARDLRRRYIRTFVDTRSKECSDIAEVSARCPAATYWSYLWDCLRDPTVIDCRFVDGLADSLREVLVLWDLHPDRRVAVQNYWKFQKDDVLSLDYNLLLRNLRHLPEDIYIFDRSFGWTLVLTHEYVDDERWCLRSGQVPRTAIA